MSYFSRITLFARDSDAQQLAGLLCADAYREHQTLWRLFADDPEAQRDFLFRREAAASALRYLVVSQRRPQASAGLWQVEPKPYEPKLAVGQRLAFALRANAVVTRADAQGKPKRHDVVMDAKTRLGYKDLPRAQRPPLSAVVQEAGVAWLGARAAKHGFRFNDAAVQVDGYRQFRVRKPGVKRPVCYSTLDFQGLLEVTDPAALAQALRQGIGPAKAFGCGLLLVRRVV